VSDDPDIKRPFVNSVYGVKLSVNGDNKYLYIYDGDKNGTASDPIALVVKDDGGNGNGNGGGGCSTGFLSISLIVLPLFLRKKAA
jgi:Synergist-CTERM protein sorting domain-containing protein